jgi:hypothetical protein
LGTGLLIALSSFGTEAHAYVDPGGGTLTWQLVLAAATGALFYLRRLLGVLRGSRRRSGPRPPASA